ncbi:MAG TPA: TIGR03790 family protein, partial [Humisphaera sp.]|nr:TIGR03790 family protein [Humisphaera sp.]
LLDTCPTFGFADSKHQPASLLKKPAVDGKGMEIGELNYSQYNADMRSAADLLKARGLPVELDLNDKFIGDRTALMGYISWGSNDRHFDEKAYHQLRFAPGSLCETAVSTSARTFLPSQGGQSLIADLVAQGATGAKGYTDEPLLQAIASPTILFDRYTHGWTLAESYYAASRFVGWEDIVLGDPLCRAYSAAK